MLVLVMMHFLWCSDVQVPLKCWLLLLKSVVLKVVLFVVVVATELPLNYSVSVCLAGWLAGQFKRGN